MSRKTWQVLVRLAAGALALVLGVGVASAGTGGGTYYANSPPLRKFIHALPGLGAGAANDLGAFISIAHPDTVSYPGSDYYEIAVQDFTQQMHADLPKATKLRGYVQINNGTDAQGANTVAPDPQRYLGPLIIAQKGRPVRIKFVNLLATGTGGDLFIPVDKTLMGAGLGPNSWTWNGTAFVSTGDTTEYTQNRAELHLHGGFTPWISDGTPHQWITPAGDATPYKWGVSLVNVPDMPNAAVPVQGEQTYYYTNAQSSRLMFYHDHAAGLTRLNVYAGEAAGFLLRDDIEAALEANGTLPDLAHNIPLIIQDKSFVPDDVAIQDALWDTAKWGQPGDLWFPHVYETNQDPTQPGGMSPTGRWDYGPWFWPPAIVQNPPLNNGTVANLPQPSAVPEGFMDTMLVNGTPYPYVEVEPRRYRLRILNAGNDRTLNLQLYKADPAFPDGTEVKMLPAYDARAGGVPDESLVGPAFINIATEAGFMMQPVVSNQPAPSPAEAPWTPNTKLFIDYDKDPRSITINNILDTNLLLGPAQRADVIVDFSKIPVGTRLILYNDAPAPAPAGDSRVDYYTGGPDNTAIGGAPSTPPGWGPNTRTVMQFRVKAPAGQITDLDHAATLARLVDPSPTSTTSLRNAFDAAGEPLLFTPGSPESLANNATNFLTNAQGQKVPVYRKAIQELFDPMYGRMNSLLGTELQWTNGQNQNTNFNYYTELPSEYLVDGQQQAWMIVHNGVDTHFIHFHLVNVQVLGRVDWAGVVKPPYPDEIGWRETVRMDPLEQTIVAMKPTQPPLPATWPTQANGTKLPDSKRPLDVTFPSTSGTDTTTQWNATTNPNPYWNFGWEYVWHCHLLGHEENDMMRALVFRVPVAAPIKPTNVVATADLNNQVINVAWTVDQWQMDEIAYRIERREVGGAFAPIPGAIVYYIHNIPQVAFPAVLPNGGGQPNWLMPGYTDTSAVAGVTYEYQVVAYNNAGESASGPGNQAILGAIVHATAVSLTPAVASPHVRGTAVLFTAAGTPSSPTYEYRFWLSADGGTTWTMKQDYGVGPSWNLPASTPVGNYQVKVDVRAGAAALTPDVTSAPVTYAIVNPPATALVLTVNPASPRTAGTPITFTATGRGSTGYQYQFSLNDGTGYVVKQAYGVASTWALPANTPAGTYTVKADVRTSTFVASDRSATLPYTLTPVTAAATGVTLTADKTSPQIPGTAVTFTAQGQGSANYQYRFWRSSNNGASWAVVQDYSSTATYSLPTSLAVGSYLVSVEVRTTVNVTRDAVSAPFPFVLAWTPATGVTLTADLASPQPMGTAVTFTAVGAGAGGFQYRFWRSSNNGVTWSIVQDYSAASTWVMPSNTLFGSFLVSAEVRTSSSVTRDAVSASVPFVLTVVPATGVTVTPNLASPQTPGTVVTFTAQGQGSFGYQYRFWRSTNSGATWSVVQDYSTNAAWAMPNTTPPGSYLVSAEVRTSSGVTRDAVSASVPFTLQYPPATGVTISADLTSPQAPGTAVTFTAQGQGSGGYQYRFWRSANGGKTWSIVRDYSSTATWVMPGSTLAGSYLVSAEVRTTNAVTRDAVSTSLPFVIQ